jgi:hypothetical protein
VAARRRGLGDVLHYFIPEEEQREAREKGLRARERGRRDGPFRWCVPINPRRPLSCAFAVDLAMALREAGIDVAIAAPFSPAFVRPVSSEIAWRVLDSDFEQAPLDEQLDPFADESLLLLLPHEGLASRLAELGDGFLDGLVLLVHPTPAGLTEALSLLRAVPQGRLRLAAVLVGPTDAAADPQFRQLQGAARRQLGIEVEHLGELRHDSGSFRSLLVGRSVLDLDEDSASARSLRDLGRRLRGAAEGRLAP